MPNGIAILEEKNASKQTACLCRVAGHLGNFMRRRMTRDTHACHTILEHIMRAVNYGLRFHMTAHSSSCAIAGPELQLIVTPGMTQV